MFFIIFQDQQIYKWSDGWNLEYKNWLSNQETDGDETKCAVIDVNAFTCEEACEYPDGNWIAKPCTEKHPYLCKFGEGIFFTLLSIAPEVFILS